MPNIEATLSRLESSAQSGSILELVIGAAHQVLEHGNDPSGTESFQVILDFGQQILRSSGTDDHSEALRTVAEVTDGLLNSDRVVLDDGFRNQAQGVLNEIQNEISPAALLREHTNEMAARETEYDSRAAGMDIVAGSRNPNVNFQHQMDRALEQMEEAKVELRDADHEARLARQDLAKAEVALENAEGRGERRRAQRRIDSAQEDVAAKPSAEEPMEKFSESASRALDTFESVIEHPDSGWADIQYAQAMLGRIRMSKIVRGVSSDIPERVKALEEQAQQRLDSMDPQLQQLERAAVTSSPPQQPPSL